MQEPSLRTSRLAIAGGLAAALLVAAAGFLAGRATSPVAVQRNSAAAPAPTPSTAAPEQPQVLQRRDIIAAANLAADAYAAESPLPDAVTELAGRRFELVIPFGCDGPAPEESTAPLRWRYDQAQQTLRIHVARTSWRSAEWGIGHSEPTAARAEGFWIDRPWTSSESCPRRSSIAAEAESEDEVTQSADPSLALVQLVPGGPEGERSEPRPFNIVKRVTADQFDASEGFGLRLTGRVRALAGQPPILCTQADKEHRPTCALTVVLEELAVEASGSAERLGTWSLGQRARPES